MRFKALLLSLAMALLWTFPAAAAEGWFRKTIDGTGPVITNVADLNVSTSGKNRQLYYYFTSTTDSLWITVGRGVRVSIFLNPNTGGTTANGTTANIKVLMHTTETAPSLNDALTLLNLTMSATEDQFYDLDGPLMILVDPQVAPSANAAYVAILVTNPPAGT